MVNVETLSTGVIESSKFIAEHAKDVKVSQTACKQVAESIYHAMKERSYSTESWSQNTLNPKTKDIATVDWIFVVDLLNFSFWSSIDVKDTGRSDTNRFTVNYDGQSYTGYWSLCAAINRALDDGIPITTPSFWKDEEECSNELIAQVFHSDTLEQIPMLQERIDCLREAGTVLTSKYGGSFANMIAQADGSAVKLVKLVVDNFKCFRDESVFEGRLVQIYKRAQILVSDIWACFNGKSYGRFDDIDSISMFADYRVPQILHNLSCLEYSPALSTHIRNLLPIGHGEPAEVELRGCSIWAVELIKEEILKSYPDAKINSILLDFYLWDKAKEVQKYITESEIPCHRTRSIYY
ncbi:hypothetical protein V1512DRAFT_44405 [Lipomyces arxii]|uniref:uncharacterized protein n=1 Tax=Lipomyces arxii TaxID=56418 RepID=UPI0034CE2F69